MKLLTALLALALVACAGDNAGKRAEDARVDAACTATRTLYKATRQELWTGPCKAYDVATECPAYVVLREVFILQLETLKCPTEPDQ